MSRASLFDHVLFMQTLTVLILILATPSLVVGEKRLHARAVSHPIIIDGGIDAVWSRADSVADFFQLVPYFNQPPSQLTVAKVLTSPEALYCLMLCYDTPDNIRAHSGLLDETSGDIVSIMLDTFNDRQSAYKFAVTSSGVRADCRLLDDARNRDYSWDGVWFAEARVYDWGFAVEMMIPYKSLKYNPDLTEWGLDFDRWIAAQSEDLYWCEYERNEGQRVSRFGRLVFTDARPAATGLNLEIYPVGFTKATYLHPGAYDVDAHGGVDLFHNPSEVLTYQLTANPDFAQIEADPFAFNISRYETYFEERRPFFTVGNEVFMAAGRDRNSGFYRPLELFYSRRIGRLLPDGREVLMVAGTKASGRIGEWEYGGFLAFTGREEYTVDDERMTERRALFASARVKKQVFENSSVGVLFVGKRTSEATHGVIDIDGALRTSTWQFAYQLARSIEDHRGGYAGSAGFTFFGSRFMSLTRLRVIDHRFDVHKVGFVPWQGTFDLASISGPIWYYDTGYIRQILVYAGPAFSYEHADLYTDRSVLLGFNMQLRDNWGYEINLSVGRSRDAGHTYTSYEASLGSWYYTSAVWNGNLWGGYARTYNFSREYPAFYSWMGLRISWRAHTTLDVGTTYNMWVEGTPAGDIADITYNARPFASYTPWNDLNIRLYMDNVFVKSTDRIERMLIGFLFSYNFLPKSWIYLAVNEVHDRSDEYDAGNNPLPGRLHIADRVAVLKAKYLYYF